MALESMNAFAVSKLDTIKFFDCDSYKELPECKIKIPLMKSQTREPSEIISMVASSDENYIAVISGKNLVKNEQFPNQLFVFKKIINLNVASERDRFELIKRVVIKDRAEDF